MIGVPGTQHAPQGESTAPPAQVPAQRFSYRDLIPPWPETLIEPLERELDRWIQLWNRPQATVWTRKGQENTVATLVRLELFCARSHRVPAYRLAELSRVRRELGLTLDI